MRLAIVGSRGFTNYNLMLDIIRYHFMGTTRIPSLTIISGGARGADTLADEACNYFGLDIQIFYPNWEEEGKSAGLNRNTQIVNACDMVLAFWDGKSRGTADTIEKAKRAKKPTFIVYY